MQWWWCELVLVVCLALLACIVACVVMPINIKHAVIAALDFPVEEAKAQCNLHHVRVQCRSCVSRCQSGP